MKFYTRYSRPDIPGLVFDKPSLTAPQFQRDTDVNYMVKRYVAGDMSVFRNRPVSGDVDVSGSPASLHACLNKVADADTAFQELPRSLKHAFGNAANFLAYLDQREQQAVEDVKTPASETVTETVTSKEAAKV